MEEGEVLSITQAVGPVTCVRDRPELSSFSQAYDGTEGSRAAVRFLKMSFMTFMMHCDFGGLNITIFSKYCFGS